MAVLAAVDSFEDYAKALDLFGRAPEGVVTKPGHIFYIPERRLEELDKAGIPYHLVTFQEFACQERRRMEDPSKS